jgi:hypothetical protein
MISKKNVFREGVMMHVNFLENELPAVKVIVNTIDGKVTQEMTKLENFDAK